MSLTSYTTPLTGSENPISESGVWLNGGTDGGGNWADVSKDGSGHAIGHQTGATGSDSTSVLKATTWPDTVPDYEVTGTAWISAVPADTCSPEIELRSRSKITSVLNRGYESAYGFKSTPYNIIVRWNGTLGSYDAFINQIHPWIGIADGDALKMRTVGGAVSAYMRGVLIGRGFDATWTDGQPGMGFNLENGAGACAGANLSYGLKIGWTSTEIASADVVAAANGGLLDIAGGEYGTVGAFTTNDSSANQTSTVLERAIAPDDCLIVVTAYADGSGNRVLRIDDGSSGKNQYQRLGVVASAGDGESAEVWACTRAVAPVTGNPTITAKLDAAYSVRGISVYHLRRRVALGPTTNVLNATGVTSSVKAERKGLAVQIAVDVGAQKLSNYTANNGWTHRGEAVGTLVMGFGDREISGSAALSTSWSLAAADNTANFLVMLYDDPKSIDYTAFPKSPIALRARRLL